MISSTDLIVFFFVLILIDILKISLAIYKKKKKTGTETRTTEWKGKKRQEFPDYNANLTNLVNCSKEGGHLHFAQVVVAV